MREEIVIRSLEPDEWAAYKTLRLEALKKEPQAFGLTYAGEAQKPDEYWRKRLEDARTSPDAGMRFAVRNGVPVGLVAAAREASGHIGVFSVYVTAAERGQKIGRMLLETILRDIKAQSGAVTAALDVNKEQRAAVALYTSLGFTIVGETRAVLGDGREHTEYQMTKNLGQTPVADGRREKEIAPFAGGVAQW